MHLFLTLLLVCLALGRDEGAPKRRSRKTISVFPKKDDAVEREYGLNGFMGPKAKYQPPKADYVDSLRMRRGLLRTSQRLTPVGNRKLKGLFFFSRHGSRHSLSTERIERMLEIFRNAQSQNALRKKNYVNYTLDYLESEKQNIGRLAAAATEEIRNLTSRLFGPRLSFFKQLRPSASVFLESTLKERTNQTLHLYRDSLIALGVNPDVLQITSFPTCDSLNDSLDYLKLRGFEVCHNFQLHHRQREWNQLLESIKEKERKEHIDFMLDGIFTGIFIKRLPRLYEPVELIYHACSMNNLYSDMANPFCQLVPTRVMRLMNYLMDVDSYFDKGPQFPINFGFGCVFAKELLQFLVQNGTEAKGRFFFGHNESLYPLLAFLGVFKDLASFREARDFRTAQLYPMTANLLVELFEETDGSTSARFILNEHEFSLPKFCPVESVKKHLIAQLDSYGMGGCYRKDIMKLCGSIECIQTRN